MSEYSKSVFFVNQRGSSIIKNKRHLFEQKFVIQETQIQVATINTLCSRENKEKQVCKSKTHKV